MKQLDHGLMSEEKADDTCQRAKNDSSDSHGTCMHRKLADHKSLVIETDAAFLLMWKGDTMKCIFAGAMLVLGATTASAQENCDIRSTVETRPGAIVFQQFVQCDEREAVTTFSCKPGNRRIRVSLPYSSPIKGNGENLLADVQTDGTATKRRFRITSRSTSETMLERDDPLWIALSTVGSSIQLSSEDGETSVGLREEAAASLEKWKEACKI
jgi:hypothetical protein